MSNLLPFRRIPRAYEVCEVSPKYALEQNISLLLRAQQAGLQCSMDAAEQLQRDIAPFHLPQKVVRLPSGYLSNERFRSQQHYEAAMRSRNCRPLPTRVLLEWLIESERFPAGYFLVATRPKQLCVIKSSVDANVLIRTNLPDNTLIATYDWLATYTREDA